MDERSHRSRLGRKLASVVVIFVQLALACIAAGVGVQSASDGEAAWAWFYGLLAVGASLIAWLEWRTLRDLQRTVPVSTELHCAGWSVIWHVGLLRARGECTNPACARRTLRRWRWHP